MRLQADRHRFSHPPNGRLRGRYISKVFYVARDKILGMRSRDLEGSIKIDTLNALLTGAQQLVRAVLNPVGDIGVGRSSVRWIVFEPAIGWRVVRRGDDDAICKSLRPTPVVTQNGVAKSPALA